MNIVSDHIAGPWAIVLWLAAGVLFLLMARRAAWSMLRRPGNLNVFLAATLAVLGLWLIKTGIKLGSLMPHQASEAIDKTGFDFAKLAELEGDELMDALSELQVHIESAGGDEVQVFCE